MDSSVGRAAAEGCTWRNVYACIIPHAHENPWHISTQDVLQRLGAVRSSKCKYTILHGVSGVLLPGRLALLLGPPGSSKSTLLRALAGKAVDGQGGLRVQGQVPTRFLLIKFISTFSIADNIYFNDAIADINHCTKLPLECYILRY